MSPEGKHIFLETSNNTPTLTTQQAVVNKINELEAYAVIDAKSQTGRAGRPDATRQHDHSTAADNDNPDDPKGLFFLEIFSGCGRLSSSVEKHLKRLGREDIKVIRIEFETKMLLQTDKPRTD